MQEVFQKQVLFSGHVQGVGFRYMTYQIAKEFEVAGWVKNLADGRVELQCEGETAEVNNFVEEVTDRLDSYIRKVETSEKSGPRRFKGFEIAH